MTFGTLAYKNTSGKESISKYWIWKNEKHWVLENSITYYGPSKIFTQDTQSFYDVKTRTFLRCRSRHSLFKKNHFIEIETHKSNLLIWHSYRNRVWYEKFDHWPTSAIGFVPWGLAEIIFLLQEMPLKVGHLEIRRVLPITYISEHGIDRFVYAFRVKDISSQSCKISMSLIDRASYLPSIAKSEIVYSHTKKLISEIYHENWTLLFKPKRESRTQFAPNFPKIAKYSICQTKIHTVAKVKSPVPLMLKGIKEAQHKKYRIWILDLFRFSILGGIGTRWRRDYLNQSFTSKTTSCLFFHELLVSQTRIGGGMSMDFEHLRNSILQIWKKTHSQSSAHLDTVLCIEENSILGPFFYKTLKKPPSLIFFFPRWEIQIPQLKTQSHLYTKFPELSLQELCEKYPARILVVDTHYPPKSTHVNFYRLDSKYRYLDHKYSYAPRKWPTFLLNRIRKFSQGD